MIVLATLSVLFAIGMPAFGRLLHDIHIRGSAEGLRAALQTARVEAVTRNALVRLSIGDATGRPVWSLGCVNVTARCPQTISAHGTGTGADIRWGAALANAGIAFSVALNAGHQMPASLTFNAFGMAPGVSQGEDAVRIDVMHAENTDAKRLVVVISPGGAVRLCDPAASDQSPMHCA